MCKLNIFLTVHFTFLVSVFYHVTAYERHKVVVIGAGASGIAAAMRLLENKVLDIIILEAEGRYGGRIKTIRFGKGLVELGAEWCHGQKGNAVFDMMEEHEVFNDLEYTSQFAYSNGHKIDDDITSDIQAFLEKLPELTITDDDKDSTLGDVIFRQYDREILEKYKNDENKLKFGIEAFSNFETYMITQGSASSWFNRSAQTSFELVPGTQTLTWKKDLGYKKILEAMMKTFEYRHDNLGIKRRILYNKTVYKINWRNEFNNAVLIWCNDGSTYAAEHVIFTPSLGVLKANHEELFLPQLSQVKKDAIENFGFGGVMKIIITFSRIWWKDEFLRISLVWSAEDKVNLPLNFPDGPIEDDESWISRVTVIHTAPNNKNALVAWVTGNVIKQLEKAPREYIQDGMNYIFEKFFGEEYNITEPDSIIHTHWCTNPNYLGTYSYETVESKKLDFNCNEVLSEPLRNDSGVPVLLFAGEATSTNHYSTVHGAIETGHREADRILDAFKHHDKWKKIKAVNL